MSLHALFDPLQIAAIQAAPLFDGERHPAWGPLFDEKGGPTDFVTRRAADAVWRSPRLQQSMRSTLRRAAGHPVALRQRPHQRHRRTDPRRTCSCPAPARMTWCPASRTSPIPTDRFEGGKAEYGPPPEGSDGDPAVTGSANVQVRFLKPAGRIIVPSLWEFIPYNDAAMQPLATALFIRRVKRIAGAFLAGRRRQSVMLRLLKRIYQRTFGSGSVPANLISLFLYAGPIGTRVRFDPVAATAPFRMDTNRDNLAQLATGDGFLDTPARLAALQRFYGRSGRLDRAGLLQVMHHGARPN